MGCNCGSGKSGQTIAQKNAARTATRSMPEGFSAAMPRVLGDPNDDDARRVRVLAPALGLRVGVAIWVTGSLVDEMLQIGTLHDISNVGQKQRQYKVGAFTYTDPKQAARVAAADNLEVIEVA